jgi:hypothetical protein
MLVGIQHFIYKRRVLMILVCGNRRSGAKVQSPEDSMAQKERYYKQE